MRSGQARFSKRVSRTHHQTSSWSNRKSQPAAASSGPSRTPSTADLIGPSTWFRSSWSSRSSEFGDYAPIAVLSHEWGHHIQTLLGVVGPTRKDFELQADCLMGAFTRYADEQALLDYGDFLEALNSAIDAGDEVFLPEDFPGAHGMAEDRVKALTKGYGGGPVIGCNLPIVPIPDEPENPRADP